MEGRQGLRAGSGCVIVGWALACSVGGGGSRAGSRSGHGQGWLGRGSGYALHPCPCVCSRSRTGQRSVRRLHARAGQGVWRRKAGRQGRGMAPGMVLGGLVWPCEEPLLGPGIPCRCRRAKWMEGRLHDCSHSPAWLPAAGCAFGCSQEWGCPGRLRAPHPSW